MIDPEHEKRRLSELYSQLSDGELLKVFADVESLTEIAQDAVLDEIENRDLEPPIPQSQHFFELGNFTMIRRYRDLPEAVMARGGLESAGIKCHLEDENMVRMDWFWSNLLGGVKLYVRSEDVDAAEEILEDPAPFSYEVEGMGRFDRPTCPRCGSIDIAFEELNKPIAFASAYFNVPIPVHRTGWRCHLCEHHWASEQTEDSES